MGQGRLARLARLAGPCGILLTGPCAVGREGSGEEKGFLTGEREESGLAKGGEMCQPAIARVRQRGGG